MKLNIFIVGMVCGMLSIEAISTLQAQSTNRTETPAELAPSGQNMQLPYFSGPVSTIRSNGTSGFTVAGPSWRGPMSQRQVEIRGELHKALSELKQTESEGDREEAIRNLRGVLGDQYDESLNQYEEYLETLEEKIKEMKAQIEKRRDAKMDLVDLRLKTLVNEADGLGWPDGRSGSDVRYFPGNSQTAPFATLPERLPSVRPPTRTKRNVR